MDRASGEASHSSKARKWQRLHLFDWGKTFSNGAFLGAFFLTEFWARLRWRTPPPAKSARAVIVRRKLRVTRFDLWNTGLPPVGLELLNIKHPPTSRARSK
jgi:hypothetical protein